jgi:photosystem II stability/assembly factor-like uncharacterized protein
MEVRIAKRGWKQGTSGWLAEGLQEGSITIGEGTTTAGKHGLFLRATEGTQTLAVFDPEDYDGRYAPLTVAEEGLSEGMTSNKLHLTPAVVVALHALAQDWCDQQNAARDNDEEIHLQAVYAE